MKTGSIASGEPIWNNNEDLLGDEGPLPIIGTCHISSILSNIDSSVDRPEGQQNDTTQPATFFENNGTSKFSEKQVHKNYQVLKENKTEAKKNNTKNRTNDFENMLYFVCNLCPFLCTNNSKITEHLEVAHKNKTIRKLPHLKCPACNNVFFHKMPLRSHLIHDHGVGNSDINQIIQAVVYYANKAKTKDKNNKSRDASNGGKLKMDSKFETKGVVEETEEKLFILPKVELNQNNAEKMFNSMMNETNPISKILGTKKLHKCVFPNCKVAFQNAENCNYHISCHNDSGFICPLCNEKFLLWKPLSGHLWRWHKMDLELYSCDKCDYKSVSQAKLNNIHKLIHGDVRAFVCNVCKKAFKNRKQLGNHKITHKSDYEKLKCVCELCSKGFGDKRQLRMHMNVVHEKIKPFLCSYCGYKGSSRGSLRMHIRQHTGEKPFACDSCSYTTSDHNSLRRHKLRHSGQKPYKCSYCSYACIQSSTYKVHLKTKHPGLEKNLMFTCQECQFRSVNKEIYTTHIVTVHNQKLDTNKLLG